MFSMCSELTPRAHIPDTRIPQLMQPCLRSLLVFNVVYFADGEDEESRNEVCLKPAPKRSPKMSPHFS